MATVRDPVCGMEVDTATAIRVDHGGHAHYFCSEACRDRFVADPAKYGDRHAAASGDDPPYTVTKDGMTSPKFGSAGSGGLEYEPLPPGARD